MFELRKCILLLLFVILSITRFKYLIELYLFIFE